MYQCQGIEAVRWMSIIISLFKDICNPITKEFRTELYDAIIEGYKNAGKENNELNTEKNEVEEPPFTVKVTQYEREGSNIKGLARIYLDDKFVINNVTLIQGKENVFVAMPSYRTKQKDKDGKTVYKDICFPVTKEFREKLYGEIMETYNCAQNRSLVKSNDIFKPQASTNQFVMEHTYR